MEADKKGREALLVAAALAWGCASYGGPGGGEAESLEDHDLVELGDVAPEIRLDIRYATPDNFTGRAVYPVAACYLNKEVARALARVQAHLESSGLGLKVYDCYRPLSIQKEFWELVQDERYVADPAKGSRHNRGYAVDVTLVGRDGGELPMPSSYDDFSERAHRDFPAPPDAAYNREALEEAMARQGFKGLPTEWWHFDYPGWERAPLLDAPLR